MIEEKEKFKSSFDNAPIGIALVSTEGKFIAVNKSLTKLLGYSKEELEKLNFSTNYSSIRILVVEDERPLIEAIKDKLESNNFEVLSARTV